MLLYLLLALQLFSQDKVLIEEGVVSEKEEKQEVSSDAIDLMVGPQVVLVSGDRSLPQIFEKPLFKKDLQELIEVRSSLTCMSAQNSSLACYRCEQKDDYFTYSYTFSKINKNEDCLLSSYRINMPQTIEAEEKILNFMKSQNLEILESRILTPMVFEKESYQIYIESLANNYSLRFEDNEISNNIKEIERNQSFLADSIKKLWPRYEEITKQYLKELSSAEKKISLDQRIQYSMQNDEGFIQAWQDLKDKIKDLDKEKKACIILQNSDLFSYSVNDELNKGLKESVRYHWSEAYKKELQDSVCGNYYHLLLARDYLIDSSKCYSFEKNYFLALLKEIASFNINQMEKDLISLFQFSFKIKDPSVKEEEIKRVIEDLKVDVPNLDSYKKYKLENPTDTKDTNIGLCL